MASLTWTSIHFLLPLLAVYILGAKSAVTLKRMGVGHPIVYYPCFLSMSLFPLVEFQPTEVLSEQNGIYVASTFTKVAYKVINHTFIL